MIKVFACIELDLVFGKKILTATGNVYEDKNAKIKKVTRRVKRIIFG